MDFILNGQATGDVASRLMACNFQPTAMQPWIGEDHREYVTMIENGKPVSRPTGRVATHGSVVGNADSTLRKDEWQLLDRAIIQVARDNLNAVSELRSRGLEFRMPNGMAHTVLQHQTQSDIGPATVSMDGIARSDSDQPVFDITNLPLPIIHKDFHFTARELAVSRNSGIPLDTSNAETATRKVAEEAESLLVGIGDFANYTYGGGVIYGLTNYPSRLTYTMTTPTGIATNATTIQEILEMRQDLYDAKYRGPYTILYSPQWDQFLDDDYSSSKGDGTLRDRIMKIDKINSLISVDYLTGFQMVVVQMTSDVIREVVGMEITPMRWESEGGMLLHYKVMAIMVPQLRKDYNGNTGILHATAVSGGSTTTTTT